jgi:predicted dehydrogenase
LHAQHAIAALEAGKHVICEKPMARTVAEGQAMLDAAKEADRQLLVGQVVRFFPEFRRLHDAIQGGQIGEPAIARLSRVSRFPHGSGEWYNEIDLSGGAILDMGVHDLDWLLWTLGPAERVYARGLIQQRIPYMDYGLMTVRLANGAICHVESSWAETSGFSTFGEISGDEGMLTYDSRENPAVFMELREPPETSPGVAIPGSYTQESPYVTQLRHLARCILGLEEPIVTAEEALQAIRLALAAIESIDTNEPVELEEEA